MAIRTNSLIGLSMPFKTMRAIGYGVAYLSATAIAEDLYQFLSEIPIGGEGGLGYSRQSMQLRASFISRTPPKW